MTAEIERRKKKKEIREKRERDEAAEPPTLARDSRNLIFLNDGEYKALVADLGEAETERCISYLSEYCSTHNKKYHDWPTMIRKASKERWGLSDPGQASAPTTDFQPSAEQIRASADWLDSFLAEQQKKEGGGKWDNLPGVTRL